MVILSEVKSISELEDIIKQHCPQNKIWNLILEAEKEMYSYMETKGAGEESVIAYKITDGPDVAGLLQYSYIKGGFLKKEKIVIHIFTLFSHSYDIVRMVHQELIQKHQPSGGELIHAVSSEEDDEICVHLQKDGFEEHKDNGGRSKYGCEPGAFYYVKAIGN